MDSGEPTRTIPTSTPSGPAGPLTVFLSWIAYPIAIAGSLLLFTFLRESGIHELAAGHLAVLVGAVAMTLLERLLPERDAWRGDRGDVKTDLTYMLLVQLALPAGLTLVLALGLLSVFGPFAPHRLAPWPHAAPIWVQAGLMLLVAEFLRYWLHRAAHKSRILWRLHAVHHSPDKLYWLNVGRFHPMEKGIQFLFDVLPFGVMGVREEVLLTYMVFYAVHGFFQHSNVRVRLGVLNHLVAGPELHRWHHSRDPTESDHNFGNNLILWDTLFRTRFLPADRQVGALGLKDPDYPSGFLGQMVAPLIRSGTTPRTAPAADPGRTTGGRGTIRPVPGPGRPAGSHLRPAQPAR